MKQYILIIIGILCLQSCVVTRGIKYGNASVDDYSIFKQDTVVRGLQTFRFADVQLNSTLIDTLKFDIYLSKADTLLNLTLREAMDYYDIPSAAIVVQNDTILFEHYSGGWNRDSQSCIFSVTKTITSLLCGIALKHGYIKSLSDPVTDYIPELKDADPTFAELKIEYLLDMTAGLKFNENYSWNPFSKMAKLYFGNNTLKVLKSLKFINTPGENFSYDSATTAILGLVIERATGQSYAQYLSEKVWQPLGMERDALIGLDSKKHHTAKSFAGLTTNVRDLAKIGKLFLNNGVYNGVQIVDSTFVNRCLSTHTAGISGKAQSEYSYSWYWGVADEENGKRKFFNTLDELKLYYKNHPEKNVRQIKKNLKNGYFAVLHNGGFWGFGLYGQVLYVNPEKNMIAVFLGADRLKDFNILFDQLSTYLN
ncbi:MAG: serine hydrolase [Alistipes sp.]|nr:serine hydrolase [Alistipes sp.]MBR3892716.1 serine hydrolase [Alistipes sp.]